MILSRITSRFNHKVPQAPQASDPPGTGWREKFLGGSILAELRMIRKWTVGINEVQYRNRKKAGDTCPMRAFHALMRVGVDNAELRILDDVPAFLEGEFFSPGRVYQGVNVRLSNASGVPAKSDTKRDLRGLAVEVDGNHFLMTSAAASHAKNAREFMQFAMAESGMRLFLIPKLTIKVGPLRAIRMVRTVLRQSGVPVASLAYETFWSRAPFACGVDHKYAVKFACFPTAQAPQVVQAVSDLKSEFDERLRSQQVSWTFAVQLFVNEDVTPIEDGTVEWDPQVSPFIPVAQLVLPQQDETLPAQAVNKMEFNPWVKTDVFRPLGSLNRARKRVYQASAGYRNGLKPYRRGTLLLKVSSWLLIGFFRVVNVFVQYDKLPTFLGAANLLAWRRRYLEHNFSDTDDPFTPLNAGVCPFDPKYLSQRSDSGEWNDLSDPTMGAVGQNLGRNVPLEDAFPDEENLLNPNPVVVADKLLSRREGQMIEATSVNMLVVAWILTILHDLFFHGEPVVEDPVEIPVAGGCPMKMRRTPKGPQSQEAIDAGMPPVFANKSSAWWDASWLYGSDRESAARVRNGILINVDEAGRRLLIDMNTNMPVIGFLENMWLGTFIMGSVWALEHNFRACLCRQDNPEWSDDEVFHAARDSISKSIANVHTNEWTTAVLAIKSVDKGLHSDWWGFCGKWVKTHLGRLNKSGILLSGIPGSEQDQHGGRFNATEEFTTVYRMHSFLPDHIQLYNATTGEEIGDAIPLANLTFIHAQDIWQHNQASMADVFYSFGTMHPGALRLHNYPDAMRNLNVYFGETGKYDRHTDMAVTDIFRDRERGVPRYNRYRQLFGMGRVKSFDALVGNTRMSGLLTVFGGERKQQWRQRKLEAAEIRDAYGVDEKGKDNVDLVDFLVGTLAEPLMKGAAFSDSQFRTFIVQTPRRLQSDRFYTTDYGKGGWKRGNDLVDENTFKDVLVRHFPELIPVLRDVDNAFAPWPRLADLLHR